MEKMKVCLLLLALACALPIGAKPCDSTDVSTSSNIIHTQWYSHTEQLSRRVDIYIPRGYCSDDTLPALYLIHGINGYEGSWEEKGSATDTLEKLIADGRCQPMMLVMPDCNKWPYKERPDHKGNLWRCLMRYHRLSHEHEIEHAISDLMDMMDTTYHVSTCAIAGLSDGARMAANVANVRPDRICAVGLFSPVLHREQLPDTTGITPRVRSSLCPYHVYVGTKDIFSGNGRRYYKRLCRRNDQARLVELPENHTWRMWRQCLSDFLMQ